MSLKDIYEEFWEYISVDNEEFKIFITKDIRRKENLSKVRYQQGHTSDFTPHVCKNLD